MPSLVFILHLLRFLNVCKLALTSHMTLPCPEISLALGRGGMHYDIDKEAGDSWALALKLFDSVDDNGDGELSWAELHEYLCGPQAWVEPLTTGALRVRHSPALPFPDLVWESLFYHTTLRTVIQPTNVPYFFHLFFSSGCNQAPG